MFIIKKMYVNWVQYKNALLSGYKNNFYIKK